MKLIPNIGWNINPFLVELYMSITNTHKLSNSYPKLSML